MIEIMKYDKNPLTYLGSCAAECYGQNKPKRYKSIAEKCILSEHGRVTEFPTITMKISEHSAKAIRDLYTHIIGTTRLGSSTRYIDYSKCFNAYVPPKISDNEEALEKWKKHQDQTYEVMQELKEMGVPLEDYTALLPLAYEHTIVLKINLRALVHMFHIRSCTLAYHECRVIMNEIEEAIYKLEDEEWDWCCKNLFVPKCVHMLYCTEGNRSCGMRPTKEYVKELLNKNKED